MRVILCSDQPILEQGLRWVLSRADMALDGVAGSIEELTGVLATEQFDIVLMDLMPEVTFGAMANLKRNIANPKIVLWVDTISTEMAFQAMGLGMRGILRKSLPTDLIAKCLTSVNNGELWFEKALTDAFISARRIALTQREGQLVSLLAQGMKNKEIAEVLNLTEGTVKVYMCKLFRKVGVNDRFELALYGLKNLACCRGGPATAGWKRPEPKAASMPLLQGLRSIVLDRGAA